MRSLPKLLSASLVVFGCGGGSSSTGPSFLSVSVPVSPIVSGTSVQAVATITDGTGRSSQATSVTWSSSNKDVVSVSATGVLTAAKVGSATITASAHGLVGQLSVGVTPGAPVSIAIVSGSGQTATHGSTLPDPLCTTILDAAGNFITGVTVTYVVATGGGSIAAPTSPPTDGSGIAISGHWTLGSGTGQQTVTATASVGSVVFTANSQ